MGPLQVVLHALIKSISLGKPVELPITQPDHYQDSCNYENSGLQPLSAD